MISSRNIALGLIASLTGLCSAVANAKPLKVYILAGQSNMQGQANISTFDAIGLDPNTAHLLAKLRDSNGKVRTYDKVWISAVGIDQEDDNKEFHGNLTSGYGAKNGEKFGPELMFGIRMSEALQEPILIIKTAWGGRSLHTDFCPPGAEPYVYRKDVLDYLTERDKKSPEAVVEEKRKATGVYYRKMMYHVRMVLNDISRVYPGYDATQGYELAGFVWFQGWNDMCDGHAYDRSAPNRFGMYSTLLAQFIRDVRKDLVAPEMPFVIGVMGVWGPVETINDKRNKRDQGAFREAMMAPALLPEFGGNVKLVKTEEFWDKELEQLVGRMGAVGAKVKALSQGKNYGWAEQRALEKEVMKEFFTPLEIQKLAGKSNSDFHYLGCGKTVVRIGEAFANAILERTR